MDDQNNKTFRIRAQARPPPKQYTLSIDVADGQPPLSLMYRDDQWPMEVAGAFCRKHGIDTDGMKIAICNFIESETGGEVYTKVEGTEVDVAATPRPKLPSSILNLPVEDQGPAEQGSTMKWNAPGKASSGCYGDQPKPKINNAAPDNISVERLQIEEPSPVTDAEHGQRLPTTLIRISRTILQADVRIGDLETKWEQLDFSETGPGLKKQLEGFGGVVKKLVKRNVELEAKNVELETRLVAIEQNLGLVQAKLPNPLETAKCGTARSPLKRTRDDDDAEEERTVKRRPKVTPLRSGDDDEVEGGCKTQ